MKIKKILEFATFNAITLIIVLSVATVGALADSREIKNNVLRMHILANTDSEYDQQLKLKVRDRLLDVSGEIFSGCENLEDALAAARENRDFIKEEAIKTLRENNCNLGVNVNIGDIKFPTKYYENDIALPAGIYSAVQVIIGEGKGKNWWCMMYPQVCVSGAVTNEGKTVLKNSLSEKGFSLSLKPENEKAKVRFKILEIINELWD